MKLKRYFSLLTLILLGSFGPAPARAQNSTAADVLFEQAKARMQAGLIKDACPMFEDSLRLDPAPITLYELADCRAQLGEILSAVRRFEEYLRTVASLPAEKKAKHEQLGYVSKARTQVETLKTQLPKVSFILPPSLPADARVERDGEVLSTASLTVALPIDPGDHIAKVIVPGKKPTETKFSVAKGETKTVELAYEDTPESAPVASASPAPPPPPKPSSDALPVPPGPPQEHRSQGSATQVNPWRIVGYSALGLGGAAALAGGILGGINLSRKNELHKKCPRDDASGTFQCGGETKEADRERFLQTQTIGLAATVLLSVGLPVAAGGWGVLMWGPSGKEDRGGKASLRMNIAGLGTKGAFFSMDGAW